MRCMVVDKAGLVVNSIMAAEGFKLDGFDIVPHDEGGVGDTWDGLILTPAAIPVSIVREATSVTRMDFCIALAAQELLTHDEAIAAAKGDWPAPMAAFLTFLDGAQALDAQVEWASATTIHRMHPFVLSLGSWLVLTDTAVDALFGINI